MVISFYPLMLYVKMTVENGPEKDLVHMHNGCCHRLYRQ